MFCYLVGVQKQVDALKAAHEAQREEWLQAQVEKRPLILKSRADPEERARLKAQIILMCQQLDKKKLCILKIRF